MYSSDEYGDTVYISCGVIDVELTVDDDSENSEEFDDCVENCDEFCGVDEKYAVSSFESLVYGLCGWE